MKSWVGETRRQTTNQAVGIIKQQYQKGYQIPAIPYQQYGVLTRILWTTKTQILRIIPGHDPQTGEIFRQNERCDRYSKDAQDKLEYLSDTFMRIPIIEKFGDVGPVISSYPQGSHEATLWGGETVLRRFARDIMYACSDKSSKKDIVPTNEMKMWCAYGGKARLSFDNVSLLMQALIFHTNGRNNQNAETKGDLVDQNGNVLPLFAVCALTNTESFNRLVDALVEPRDWSQPLDAQTNNQYGALAELNGNLLYLNPAHMTSKNGKVLNVLDPSVQPAGMQGWTPTPFPLTEDVARSLWIPWEQLLHPLTMEEQFELCAQEFGADTVNYVIGTDKFLQGIEIPEKIRLAGYGRYTNLIGNTGSVTLSSGVPNVVQAGGGMAMPAFNSQGLPSPVTGAPLQQPAAQAAPAAAAPAMSFPAPAQAPSNAARQGITPVKTGATGIQNTSTTNVQEIMQRTAAIRAAAGMGGSSEQADKAGALLGSLPSEEDQ